MGVFTRFKDIISSNLNSMLDRAEDPEKMIRLMIQEMEETLVELKAGCAGLMADRKRISRERDEMLSRIEIWEGRAKLAVDKGREDLAREALLEKHRLVDMVSGLENEQNRFDALIDQSREDLDQLEEKLESARERQRSLVKRHIRAGERVRARNDIGRSQSNNVMMRFDRFEARVERLEAEAELAGPSKNRSLEDEFSLLEGGDQIDAELEALKKATSGTKAETESKDKK